MEDDYSMIECIVVLQSDEEFEDTEEGYEVKAGSKKRRDSASWQDNARKQAKCEGKTYIGRNGNVVPEKTFVNINSCCLQHCYKKFDSCSQFRLFSSFYAFHKTKQAQDRFIASMIIKVPRKSVKCDISDSSQRSNRWTYEVTIDNAKVGVCQAFLLKIFQLSQKRIRVIQKRLLGNESTFMERRGKHDNRPHKLRDDIIELFHAHIEEMLRDEKPFRSLREHFKDAKFTKKRLFQSFQDYYLDKTGEVLPMKYNTYVQLCNRSK